MDAVKSSKELLGKLVTRASGLLDCLVAEGKESEQSQEAYRTFTELWHSEKSKRLR